MKRTLALVISAAMLVMAGTAQAQDQTVNGNLTVTGNSTIAGNSTFGTSSSTYNNVQINGGPSASPFMSFWQGNTRRGYFQFQDWEKKMLFACQYGGISFFTGSTGTITGRMMISSTGQVGVGTLTPTALLHVVAPTTATTAEIRCQGLANGSPVVSFYQGIDKRGEVQYDNSNSTLKLNSVGGGVAFYANNATPRLFINSAGNIGVGTATPTTKLTVAGETTTNVINITGGSDLAEQFQVRPGLDKVEPGMVVCIDAQHPGELKVSGKAYDKTVAGVVSGANGLQTGMRMGQTGSIASGAHAIALTGRVYCKADTSRGAIEPGDLLTTSAKAGHAMKASDVKKSQGAIIGKAMTGLEAGKTGMVLVLVNLQ